MSARVAALTIDAIFPDGAPPPGREAVEEGRAAARAVRVGESAFLSAVGAPSEAAFKEREAAADRIMQHAQIGYRSLARSVEAARTIHARTAEAGGRVDRYGICLDWSMGYPRAERKGRPRGTGLILEDPEQFAEIANAAPVAAHFGDFVIGTPAALENTAAALQAGSTAIGNLGQYFTFEMPGWRDDVATTRATVAAIALAAAQPVPVLIHSNLDDGFAARFSDLACASGAVLLERYIVEGLLGGRISHCYGHTFSEPVGRFAFQRALAKTGGAPGTMVYGNTTGFGADAAGNYAALAAYLSVDIQAQRLAPTGHAVHPVPLTEAERIPDVDEVVAVQVFCAKLAARLAGAEALVDPGPADALADRLIEGGTRFKRAALAGLEEAGVDIADPLHLLLALRRVGAKRLEALYGPGAADPAGPNGRRPIAPSPVLAEISDRAAAALCALDPEAQATIRAAGLRLVTATTDVHEYGKRLLDETLGALDATLVDGGVSADPDALADAARGADAVLLSTYNGVALDYLQRLKAELAARGIDAPVFVGGKLNQIPLDSNSGLPVDVSDELTGEGAVVCRSIEDLYRPLAAIAAAKRQREDAS
ncbi:MAG: hypothetical protein RIB45_06295 [Marivibrio sp.]|uniref:hypothetical protein n=1 Tax=Marivibrio sp. TaxID=2039719 RepID=UPI0032EC1EBF